MTNINPETGIRYGCIYLNSLDPYVAEELWTRGTNLSEKEAYIELGNEIERDADNIEEEVRVAIAECDPSLVGDEDWFERRCEDAWNAAGYDSREDYIDCRLERESEHIQIEEPTIEGEYEGVTYEISHLGGAALLFCIRSCFTITANLCSPCVPGAVSIDSPSANGYEGYTVPPEWMLDEETRSEASKYTRQKV